MALFRDEAIVLRRLDYSETSQVLLVFCREHGPQRLIAKGIKRGTKTRVAVGVDLLESGTVVFSRRPGSEAQLATMTEWRQADVFAHLRRDLPRWYIAQYAAEVTGQLIETGDPHPVLFDEVRALFSDLAGERPLVRLVTYLRVFLREIGLLPRFGACVSCGREFGPASLAKGKPREDVGARTVLYFSSRQGGLICRDCEPATIEKRRVDPKALSLLLDGSGSALAAENAPVFAAFDVLDYHLTETMGRPPRLSDPVRKVLRPSRNA